MLDASRLRLFSGFVLIVFALLLCRLLALQVFQYPHYALRSANIRARVIPNIAPRGEISDRYGNVLAANKPVFSAYVIPVELKDEQYTAQMLGRLLQRDPESLYAKIVEQRKRAYEPLLIKDHLTFELMSRLEEQSYKLPGVIVGARNIRSYNYGEIASHVLGYIGEINPDTLKQKEADGYRMGDLLGLAGIEKEYESYLKGINGGRQVEVDSRGQPIKLLGEIEPIPGNNVVLTLDLELQKVAEKALGNRRGAVVAIQPKTGDVLVLVSHPAFNPNFFTAPISGKEWARLRSEANPLHNRALTAYPSGSTFKIVTAMTALEHNLVRPETQFFCPGVFVLGNRHAQCWSRHGRINFFDGMVYSCDVVFYNMGLQAGPDWIHEIGFQAGLGQKTHLDLPAEATGLIPSSEWKKRAWKEPWYPGDSINLGIGQGFLQTTPLQMANLMCVIANRGQAYQPHLLKEITNPAGKVIHYFNPIPGRKIELKESTWEYLYKTLTAVVERGTGAATKLTGIHIAGKTGTAEDPPRRMPHAWFVSFAPVEDPQLVVAVFVEGGGHGGTAAAPVAKAVYQYYFEHRVSVNALLANTPTGSAESVSQNRFTGVAGD